ncbi:MAG: ketoacyl-ACP synthase III [Acidobacteriota bacterium]|jgi:3-oxoacyl-[acyl-carrier-protein] synthase-3|nr:ketoacyl-ACP synthase III [Acidobacteriota bacterium]
MAFLRAFGSYIPSRIVKNEELAPKIGVTAEWIESVSGIQERRFAAEGECVADLAVSAAKDCLVRANLPSSELGMIIVASGSAERQFPGPGVQVASRLGLENTPVIDLALPSTGALSGIVLAEKFAGSCGNILVVASECMSRIVLREPLDRNTAILFGDGAGACLISPDGGCARICDFLLCTNGRYSEDLRLDFCKPLQMNGSTVILHAARKLPTTIQDLLSRNALHPMEVDAYLLHQANQNLLNRVAASLQIPPERVFSNIRSFGNTSSASILIAAADWQEIEGLKPASPVVLAAFGAGFHWGAILIRGC